MESNHCNSQLFCRYQLREDINTIQDSATATSSSYRLATNNSQEQYVYIIKLKYEYLLALVADIFAHSKCFLFSIALSTQRPAQMMTVINQLRPSTIFTRLCSCKQFHCLLSLADSHQFCDASVLAAQPLLTHSEIQL